MSTGEEELTCPFCGQLFTDQDVQTEHFASKHEMAGF